MIIRKDYEKESIIIINYELSCLFLPCKHITLALRLKTSQMFKKHWKVAMLIWKKIIRSHLYNIVSIEFYGPPGWTDMQIILCTIHCHTKKQLMVMPLVSCFFFCVLSMESLSAINLYGQLMLFCMVIQWFSCFSWFFLDNNFQFLIDIVSSTAKVLKTLRLKGNARQQLSEFNFRVSAKQGSLIALS